MAEKSQKIWFVTWPNGGIVEDTSTSISRDRAVTTAIKGWLPTDYFPDLDLGGVSYGVTRILWASMKKAGFRCYEIDVGEEITTKINNT
jgi:hypothetical protein